MKKTLSLAVLLLALCGSMQAYDFSAVAPTGQTLYYDFYGNNVQVTYPGSYNNSAFWSGYTAPSGALTIPASVIHDGTTYAVTTIGEYAFWGCNGITSVTLPSSVTSLNDDAFEGCSNLASITIPGSVEHIGNRVFSCCYALTHITIPSSVFYIGSAAFTGCSGLTSVDFNADSCTFMGSSAYPVFSNCYSLDSVTIGSNVRNIPAYAFKACSYLTSVVISDQVANIGSHAFWGCSSLTSIVIPHAVAQIGNYAFSGCSNLTSVVFEADSCLSMGNHTYPSFYNCSQLASVTISSNVKTLPNYAFYSCNNIDTIFALGAEAPSLGNDAIHSGAVSKVPCEAVDRYQLAGWPNVTNADPVPEYRVGADDEVMGEVEVLLIPTCPTRELGVSAIPHTGYHFVHWSDGDTSNPYTLTLTSDTALVAYFASDIQNFAITVESNDSAMGTVSGGGEFAEGTITTITATANQGYCFVQWQDGNTEHIRIITVTADATYTAYFEAAGGEGIAEAEIASYTVRAVEGRIVIEGAVGREVRLYDIQGRLLRQLRADRDPLQLEVSHGGVYLLQVDSHAAQKVVVF